MIEQKCKPTWKIKWKLTTTKIFCLFFEFFVCLGDGRGFKANKKYSWEENLYFSLIPKSKKLQKGKKQTTKNKDKLSAYCNKNNNESSSSSSGRPAKRLEFEINLLHCFGATVTFRWYYEWKGQETRKKKRKFKTKIKRRDLGTIFQHQFMYGRMFC